MQKASDLRFRIRFDSQTETEDPAGGTLTAWAEQFSRRANIQPLKGSEPVMAQRLTGIQPVLITVRSDSNTRQITTAWRAVEVLDGTPVRYYAIKSVQDMERERQWITIMAEEGAADGGTA